MVIDVTCEAYREDEAMFYCDGHKMFGCVDNQWDQTIALRCVLSYAGGISERAVHPHDWPTETQLDWEHWVAIPEGY